MELSESNGMETKLGVLIKERRQEQGIELNTISRLTKIPEKTLRAMEDDDATLLPASVYVRGFLRQYSQIVGLNPQEMVELYRSQNYSHNDDEEFWAQENQKLKTRSLMLALGFMAICSGVGAVFATSYFVLAG